MVLLQDNCAVALSLGPIMAATRYTVRFQGGRLFGQAMMFPVQGQEEMSKFPAIKALYPTKFV
ncbi:predicted protein [Plenodomus lingam JN3]|uniref:Predicted protein n=1 Tax=Leptosphaeria maculans (strain JN3 / isolate v23.1.3 / race Av1-4-5-6-7-8) TaxID=985895 RepID=E4ZLT3_LEPMJ|nr:predicted protein [Plenodomus lingam JN3]CBX92763.1 predicted protein [Plenodomus lingam JN3]